jgi:predicted tellurium resistance membrane protein TerC
MSKRWLDEPRNVDKLWWGLCAVCGLLVGIDLFVHRHAHFDWEAWPGFYAAVGFVAFYAIVIAGKHLRKVLMRDEDYYDR